MAEDAGEDIQALRHAIRMEEFGYEFYERQGNATADANARKLFEHLREEEVEHLRTVRAQLEKLLGKTEGTRVFAEEAVSEGPFEGWWVFPQHACHAYQPARQQAPEGGNAVDRRAQELRAVGVAIEAEKRSRVFYEAWAQRAADPDGRRMYAWLAEMEQQHVNLLQWELDHLTDTGHWFDIAEFDME